MARLFAPFHTVARTLTLVVFMLIPLQPALPLEERASPFGPVLAHLLAQGRYDDARRLAAEIFAGQPGGAVQLTQLEGIILLRDGRVDEAVTVFRAILAARPDFTPARVELARALRMKGETDAAYHQFELLAHGGAHPALRQMAADAMDALRAERPLGASVRFALVPSTNFNKGSGHETFDTGGLVFSIDENARARTGLGVALGATAFAAFRIDEDNDLTVSLIGDTTKYVDAADYDHAQAGLELTYAHRRQGLMIGLGPVARYQWSGWEPYLASYGAAIEAAAPVGPGDLVTATFEVLARDFAVLDHRDGWQATGTIGLQHRFSPSASLAVTLGTTLERTQRPHIDHNDIVVGVTLRNEWHGGLITSLFASYEHHAYLGDYPAVGAPRADHKITAGVTLAHRAIDIAGFMPQVSYQYSRQVSNVTFFDYDSHDVRLGLTQSF
ncbi:surface lipoprotein assembly modifier [Pelagibacterium xiamenense]|uniref:surface lipoprotein assembly modifier n=1 Tax=Pelagibacterium xiamenense TaxID=2901140 RepID=UPI001E2FCE68|nr:surface lipoprotein assembly modifier [Pelagibacterium xiamenense]MCD7060989.1 surface lipoprotein assembly modifier [Pelagibacterium xiamenense]